MFLLCLIANQINMTESTKSLLDKFGVYASESRGEIQIKVFMLIIS